jgi:hypothetical protein
MFFKSKARSTADLLPAQQFTGQGVICISGLYKCGTSWLSLALGSHPDALALPELDIVRAFGHEYETPLRPRTPQERIRYLLTASNYGRLPAVVTALDKTPSAHELYDYLETNSSKRIFIKNAFTGTEYVRLKSNPSGGSSGRLQRYCTYWDLDEASAQQLCTLCCDANPADEAIRRFAALHAGFSGKRVIFKSADQINFLHHTERILPDAQRVVIIRDGRDMAISASKFETYIKKKTHFADVWNMAAVDFWTRLEQWAHVATVIKNAEADGRIILLRYEDLHAAFEHTLGQLLHRCGLSVSAQILADIRRNTSFAKMSGGRNKGEEDLASNIRRGITGEWREVLDGASKARAWAVAGSALEMFGYTKN